MSEPAHVEIGQRSHTFAMISVESGKARCLLCLFVTIKVSVNYEKGRTLDPVNVV